ncbi:MAG: hypothetical protein J6386_13935 [Candidatus Synoicihabitans palmerolidicus]|nr:hypothetical protein [Candidatus Synoicihabitans palmerolidicus]
MAAHPHGSPVRLTINDQTVFEGDVSPAGGQLKLNLTDVAWDQIPLRITLHTTSFRPSEWDEGSTDDQILGVRLAGIVLFFDPSIAHRVSELGLGRNPLVHESGLHGIEEVRNAPARWTDGHAQFDFELPALAVPTNLILPIAAIGCTGTDLEVVWQGKSILQTHLDQAPAELEIDLPAATNGTQAILELRSSIFTPASGDDRHLGIMINPLTLIW